MDVSKTIIVGRVGNDASMRYTPSGQAVTSFSVAVSRKYKKGEEQVKETTWFRVSTWGKLAETCNLYVKKGMEIYVEGRLVPDAQGNPRTYESNGATKASFEISAEVVQFGARSDAHLKPASAPAEPADMEEYPF